MWTGVACSMILPFSLLFLGLLCNFFLFTPSTNTIWSLGKDFITGPDLPLSLPVITITLSPFLIFIYLNNFLCKRHYRLMTSFGNFSRYWTKDATCFGQDLTLFLFYHNNCVFIKTNIRPVFTSQRRFLSDHQTQKHSLFLYFFSGFSFLNRKNNQLAYFGVSFFGTAQYFKHATYFGARVVGYFNYCLWLNHTIIKCLSFDIGLLSFISTLSPIFLVLPTSCALYFLLTL